MLYDVLMASYLHYDIACEAMEIFAEMIESGIRPNLGCILGVLSASSDLKDVRRGKCIHIYVLRRGFDLQKFQIKLFTCMRNVVASSMPG